MLILLKKIVTTLSNLAMANPNVQEVERIVSDEPPTHYLVRIQLFSALTKNSLEKYESNVFEAGGHKWKLIIYPKGNKSKNVNEHISVYLALVDTGSLSPGWEVYAVFRFFLLDHHKDNYLIIQDGRAKERRFRAMKLEWGIDELLPLRIFNDARNGYLVNDSCVFGAEVFVSKERSIPKGENLLMTKDPLAYKDLWRIENFSHLDEEFYESKPFQAGNYKWSMRIYPKGKDAGSNRHISLYLVLAETESFSPSTKICASFTLRILDQVHGRHYFGKDKYWFSASSKTAGWWGFIPLSTFLPPNIQYLVKDICFVEAEVSILGVVNTFP